MANQEQHIFSWFIPRVVPYGGAPEAIKAGWVGVPLPIRYDREPEATEANIGQDVNTGTRITFFEDSVTINSFDAVKALRLFGREQAAEWWDSYLDNTEAGLVFAVEREDQIFPDSALRLILPGIEEFDSL